jgi:hypothetical protein
MVTKLKTEDAQSRRGFIKQTAAAVVTTAIGPVVILDCWAGDNGNDGIDARKLAAIKQEDLQKVTFAALSTHPCLEPDGSSTDDEKKTWTEVMSALFPEGLDKLKELGWVRHDESKGNHVVASDRAKLRLATAHLFAIRRSPLGESKHAFRLYSEFIANMPLEEMNRTGNPYGNSPPELFDAFFNSGGQLVFVKGGQKCLDVQARGWETDNGIKLRGGFTLRGVSIILTPQPRELCWPADGGVKISLIRRELDTAKIAAHGKGFLDVAMMKDAIRAKFKALAGEKAEWQPAFYRNLKAELKPEAGLSARMDALDGMVGRNAVPEEAFLAAVLDVAAESLTTKAYPDDMKLINGVHWHGLFVESLLSESAPHPFPGYQEPPRTKISAAVNAILAVKGIVVSRAIRDTDMEAKHQQLSASFLEESDLKPDFLSAVEEVFKGIFDTLGPRRAEFLDALKQRQATLETDKTVRQVEERRESYLSSMAPLRKAEFVDAAHDGLLELEAALKEK